MNLAVHGLEGTIQQGNTFYDRVDDKVGQADFVMDNPPFNVDMVDPNKLKGDPRLLARVKELGVSVPEGWEKPTVKDAFSYLGGGTPSRKRPELWTAGTVDWYSPSDLTKSGSLFMERSKEQINDLGLAQSSAKLFRAWSVMFTSRATIGVVAINTAPATTNQGFINCLPNSRVPLYFLYCWLKANTEEFIGRATGSTFKELSKSKFGVIPILLPPERLSREFNELVEPMAKAPVVHASSRADLKKLLAEDHRYIFTLIHKFDVNDTEPATLRDNVIVIADEAHRTQNGKLAEAMRLVLPNAAFIAFTGTPLMKTDEDQLTRDTFGDYVSRYDFKRAVDDGATVKLFYDNRGEKLQIVDADINERIAAELEKHDLDQDQTERLQREMAREYHILTNEERLERIARDLCAHYASRWETGNAMLVCIDKITCVRMYDLIARFWGEEVIRQEGRVNGLREKRALMVANPPNASEDDRAWLLATSSTTTGCSRAFGRPWPSTVRVPGRAAAAAVARSARRTTSTSWSRSSQPRLPSVKATSSPAASTSRNSSRRWGSPRSRCSARTPKTPPSTRSAARTRPAPAGTRTPSRQGTPSFPAPPAALLPAVRLGASQPQLNDVASERPTAQAGTPFPASEYTEFAAVSYCSYTCR